MWLLLVFLLTILSSCSRLEEKILTSESERSLKSNVSAQAVTSWPRPTPTLHVGGKYLKDPCDNNIVLHGVAITPSPWFNGCQYGANSGYCTWDNYNVQGALNYNKAVIDKLSSAADGWYLNYIRLHIDPLFQLAYRGALELPCGSTP